MRKLAIIFGVLIGLIMIISIGAFVFIRSDAGMGWLQKTGITLAADSGYNVKIENLGGTLPWTLKADKITLADTQGIWLEIANFSFDWNPFDLMDNTVSINLLQADSIDFIRAPVSEETAVDSAPFDFSSLPKIALEKINLPRINLPQEWANNEPLQASLTASGSLDIFKAVLNVTSEETTLASLKIARQDGLRVVGGGSFTPDMVQLWKLPSDAWTLDAQVENNDSTWQLIDTKFVFGTLQAVLEGEYKPDDKTFKAAALKVNFYDLEPWSEIAATPLSGAIKAKVSVTGTLQEARIKFYARTPEVSTNATILKDMIISSVANSNLEDWQTDNWSETTFKADIKGTLNEQALGLNAEGELTSAKQIKLNEFKLVSPIASATGWANYGLEDLTIQGKLKLETVQLATVTSNAVSGALEGVIAASGKADALDISANGSVSQLAKLPAFLNKWVSNTANYEINARYEPAALTVKDLRLQSGKLTLNANGAYTLDAQASSTPLPVNITLSQPNYSPLKLSSNVAFADNQLVLDALDFSTQGTQLNGNLSLNMQTSLAQGEAKLVSDNLNGIGQWLDLPQTQGTLEASVNLKPVNQLQAVSVNASLNQLRLPSQSLAVQNIQLTSEIEDIASLQGIDATLQVTELTSGGVVVSNVQAEAKTPNAPNAVTQINVSANGTTNARPFDMRLKGQAQLAAASQEGTLNELEATLYNQPITLQSGGAFALTDSSMIISPTVVKVGDAKLAFELKRTSTVEGKVNISDLPLAMVKALTDSALPEGVVKAQMLVNGSPTAPLVNIEAQLDVTSDGEKKFPLQLLLQTVWDNKASNPRMINKLNVTSTEPLGTANLALPARLSLAPFEFDLKPNAALQGDAKLAIELQTLNPMFYALGHKLKGNARMDGTVKGTLDAPQLDGELVLENASYDQLAFGVCLRDISAKAVLVNQTITADSITAKGDRSQGTLTGKTRINLDNQKVTGNLTFDRLALFCQGAAKGEIAGALNLEGTLNALNLKGDLEIGPLVIAVPSSGVSEIPEINTITKIELAKQQAEAEAQDATIALDIGITLPQQVYVRGRGLDAEFEGDIQLQGSLAKPLIDGKLSSKRGSMELLGSRMKIAKGEISFLDRSPINPYLDITATTTASNIDIEANLSGDVKSPKLNLSSTPSRPNDEVLALLLFGRPLQSITPFQALQLARASATLAGKDSGPNVLGMVRDTLGVDALTVNQDEEGGATVGAEKYITDRVYVGVEQGTSPDSRKVKTEIEVTPNITAKTATGVQSGPSVGVEWRYDY